MTMHLKHRKPNT